MIKTVVIALSGALIAAASPALADTGRAPAEPSATASSAALVDTPAVKPAASKQRYCIIDTTTGSRIPKKTCQTRAQWLDLGFDPLAK